MAKQVTLNLKSLQKAVADLETLRGQIAAHAGTQATRLKAARDAVIDSVTVILPDTDGSDKYSDVIAYADALREAADNAIGEAVTAHLKASKDDATTGLDALRETFKVKSEAATAMRNVLVSIEADGAADVTIPTLKGTRGSGTGPKASANKRTDFYTIRNGEKVSQVASQNKLASLGWYHGAKVGVTTLDTNNGKGASVEALKAHLKAEGVEIKAGEAWQYIGPDGFGIGMDILDTPTEAPAETPEA